MFTRSIWIIIVWTRLCRSVATLIYVGFIYSGISNKLTTVTSKCDSLFIGHDFPHISLSLSLSLTAILWCKTFVPCDKIKFNPVPNICRFSIWKTITNIVYIHAEFQWEAVIWTGTNVQDLFFPFKVCPRKKIRKLKVVKNDSNVWKKTESTNLIRLPVYNELFFAPTLHPNLSDFLTKI